MHTCLVYNHVTCNFLKKDTPKSSTRPEIDVFDTAGYYVPTMVGEAKS